MTGEIVCTCPLKVNPGEDHARDCPMVTGVAAEYPIEHDGVRIGGEVVELTSAEPILARVFRSRLADDEVVMVHTDDGGKVGGTVSGLTDDGTIVVIVEGRDMYEIDVTKVVVVQTLRRNDKIRK